MSTLHPIPPPDAAENNGGATWTSYRDLWIDERLYSITWPNGDVEEFRVGGQAGTSWYHAHEKELRPLLDGGAKLPFAWLLRLRDEISIPESRRTLAQKRRRLHPVMLARELWESDPDIVVFAMSKGERLGREHDYARAPSPELLHAFDVAWERDELGKKHFYIRLATHLTLRRSYFR